MFRLSLAIVSIILVSFSGVGETQQRVHGGGAQQDSHGIDPGQKKRKAILVVPAEELGEAASSELPPDLAHKQRQKLKREFVARRGDNDIVARIGKKEVITRGQIRMMAAVLHDADPSLPHETVLGRALIGVLMDCVQVVEAEKRGIEAPLAEALAMQEEQQALCAEVPGCADRVEMVIQGVGMTEAEYWDVAKYQRQLMRAALIGEVIEEEGPEDRREVVAFSRSWILELLKRTPIQWFDPELEQRFPNDVSTFKPVVHDNMARRKVLMEREEQEWKGTERRVK